MRSTSLTDAKASLTHIIDEALKGRPSLITRHGRPEAVVLSYLQWQKLNLVPSFGRLLMAAPDAPSEFVTRSQTRARDAGL